MKITIFGLTISSSWGNGHATPYRALLRALHRMGHSVRFYEKNLPFYAAHRDVGRLDFCELVLYSDWDSIRKEAIRYAEASDVVMCASYCPEGSRISEEILGLERPLKTFYDLDTPVTLAKFNVEGRTEYLEPGQIAGFNLMLSFTGGAALSSLEGEYGAQMARPLYGCVDPDFYKRVAVNESLRCDLSYMGTYAEDRQAKLEELFLDPARKASDSQFLLAGSLYPWPWNFPENVSKLEHVTPGDHAQLYSSSRMTLNITRRDMAESGYCPSGRFFEAAACGCPILTDTWVGLDSFFSEDEILTVDSTAAVLETLTLPDSELERYAQLARQKTLDEHTGTHRARQLLRYFEAADAARTRARSEVA